MGKNVSNLMAQNMLLFLDSNGANTKEIMDTCGLSSYEIECHDGRLSEKQHYAFMSEISRNYPSMILPMLENCIKHGVMEAYYEWYPNLLGVCLNEESAISAINRFIENRIIIGSCDSITVTRNDSKTKIEYINMGPTHINNISAIGNFILLYDLMQAYADFKNIEIGFMGDLYENKGLLNNFFESRCQFNQNSNFIIVDNISLDKTSSFFNSALHSIQKNEVNKKRIELEKTQSLSGTVAKIIKNSIENMRSESEIQIMTDVCFALKISRWTLNEKLKQENTTFSDILKKVRVTMACKLLIDTNKSMQEISELVCFSSLSVFSRFFKSNLNISPLSYRQKHSNHI
ncbi:helix-turn-helix transcriptional regulator [Tolumonas lignilytica]|uniref:helix-turn-helix transcriptional regulator n=1 Tax=Tolumonas lignilytica TaxID=1283284 RepID=UPI000463CB4C|nr:helix-turn-helix transcriptional regulator [Tolumonas lignilytica]